MPAVPVLKVIITHRGAAQAKYGPAGWSKIRQGLTTLATADKARGITTRLLALDVAADAKKAQATKVQTPADSAAIKAFIDQVYATWNPAYLVLLGGPELISPVLLNNPLWTGNPDDDPDRFISSDLPYACDTGFTTAANAYRGATRAIGRIPDLMGVTDPAVLIGQLAEAAHASPTVRGISTPIFAISAKVWQVSTQLSWGKLPGVSGGVRTSPPDGPSWTKADLSPGVHFVNCHGGEFDPRWYGQASATQVNLPTAVDASLLPGLIARGTVVAAECCYGTAHWPPSAAGDQLSVAMAYLAQGASGVFGASTVAYGPAAANDYADVLARLFAEEVLNGASLGRATLSARQRFVQGQSFLDPTDVKTLAQFDLLGDPSVHPFTTTAAPHHVVPAGVQSRRAVLSALGDALGRSTIASDETPRSRAGLTAARLAQLIGRELPAGTAVRTFDSTTATGSLAATMAPKAHVAFVPYGKNSPKTLVIVRDEPGTVPLVRIVVRR
jgi:hypothetical protein